MKYFLISRKFFKNIGMGKVKQRARKPFVGRLKKKGKIRRKKEVQSEANVDEREEVNMVIDSDFCLEPELQSAKSASARKLSIFKDFVQQEEDAQREDDDCYIIVQKSSLSRFVGRLLCPACSNPAVTFKVSDVKCGFSTKGTLCCNSCKNFFEEDFLCDRVGGSTSSPNQCFDINVRAILAFRGIGCGYAPMKQWLGLMNMPYSPSQNVYQKNLKKIELASKKTFEEISQRMGPAIRKAYEEIGVTPDENGILDIAVSYDGSWQKRGYTSHNGMASVIDLMTGYPIDFEVLSNYCNKCRIAEDKNVSNEWKVKHAPNCQRNFTGSAGAMEVECAKRLWTRSVEKNNFRYTTILSDGDSKAYDAVKALKVYGESKEIQKEDCINHVAKRIGTALRNLVEVSKAQKKSIAGKGRLTKVKIQKIQNYYGRAIKDNCSDVELCKNRIMAILLHLSSTDAAPKHAQCPPGANSWCFFQRSLAKSEDPGSHKEHETLPVEIGKQLVPIFQRLSDNDLLRRCSRNKTQNPSESFHHINWKICPKTIYAGLRTISTAVSLAACQFSMGCSFTNTLCRTLKLDPGSNLVVSNKTRDSLRIKRAESAESFKAKKRRKQLKYVKTVKEQNLASSEGDMYAAGQFNC